MKDVEVEIQTRVENIEPLLKFLKQNAKMVFENHQKDYYYTPIHRDFTKSRPLKEWLRIRESGKHSITYKNWHYNADGSSNYCDEYESKIEDSESLRKIFKSLDIKPLIVVDKKRQSWLFEEYEISLDNVVGLGNFVEVEYKSHKKIDPNKKAKEMIEFLKSKGVGKVEINYSGYPHMLLFPKENYFKEV